MSVAMGCEATGIVPRITKSLRHLTLRRVIGVVCALAFLLVGFCHVVHDVNAAVPVAALQMQLQMQLQMHNNDSDDLPSGGKNAIGMDYCHGCVTVGIPVEGQTTLPRRIKTAYPGTTLARLRAYAPIAETPPPIFTI